MAIPKKSFNEVLVSAYHNVLMMEETKRKYSRTTTSFRGRNAMEYIYEAAPDGTGSRTQSEIASYLKITRPSCTALVDKLEALGYAERRKDDSDERAVDVRLTRKGRLVTTYQTAHRNEMIGRIVSEFTPEEREIIYRGFSRLNEVFEDCIETLETEGTKKARKKQTGMRKTR